MKPSSRAALLAATSLFVLASTSSPSLAADTAQEYAKQAEEALQKGDGRTALIQYRNAVKAAPEDASLHFKLGRLLLVAGDAVGAERELRAARDRKYDEIELLPLLTRAWLMQDQPEKVLREVDPKTGTPERRAVALTSIGEAQLAMKHTDEAERVLTEAEALDPKARATKLAMGRLMLARNRPTDAEAKFNAAHALEATSESWMLRGEAELQQGKTDEAKASFDQAIALDKRNAAALTERARIALAKQTPEADAAAKADLDAAVTASPGMAGAHYLLAFLAARKGAWGEADNELQKVGPLLPELPRGLYLQAVVKNALNQPEQAQAAVTKHVARFPDDVQAQKLLAVMAMKRKEPDKAIEALERAVAAKPDDAEAQDMLGRAYLATGKSDKALAAFDAASKAAPDDPAMRTRIALSKLQIGDRDAAIKDLERSLALDGNKSGPAGEVLVLSYLRAGKLDDAQRVADDLVKRQAKAPLPQLLQIMVQAERGQTAEAEARAGELADANPDFAPARLQQAELQAQQGKSDEAAATYRALLARAPTNVPALRAATQLDRARGKLPDSVALWEAAHKSAPQDVVVAIGLAEMLAMTGDNARGLAVLREPQLAEMTDVNLLRARGRFEMAQKDSAAAVATLKRAVDTAPTDLAARRDYAVVLAMTGDIGQAEQQLDEARKEAPNNDQLLRDRAAVTLKRGVEPALQFAAQAAQAEPRRPAAQALAGDVLAMNGQIDPAIDRWRSAQSQAPSTLLVMRIAQGLQRQGKSDDAKSLLADWAKKQPDDLEAQLGYAQFLLVRKETAPAIQKFEALAKQRPDDAVVLNNLAWLYGQEKDPRAIEMAKAAYRADPRSASIADTLGYVLLQTGKPQDALPYLRRAAMAAPEEPDIQVHYATALAATGAKAQAAAALQPLLANNRQFEARAEAEKLLTSLGGNGTSTPQ
jgi:cellulose synthase operon protein C